VRVHNAVFSSVVETFFGEAFFVVNVLVVVCDCGGHMIRSISCSRLHDKVGFGLAYSRRGLKDK
jgi:hypothetical protein